MHPPEEKTDFRILPVSDEHLPEAIRLLLSAEPDPGAAARQMLPRVRSGALSRELLLAAQRDGRLAGVIWANIQPGRTASVWPPRTRPDEPADTAELVRCAIDGVRERDCVLAQAMVDEADNAAGVLQAAGFAEITRMVFFVRLTESGPAKSVRPRLELLPAEDLPPGRLESLIERTYEGTLDLPELDELRDTTDLMAGYRATGHALPGGWLVATEANEPGGCLILADHPDMDAVELVYLGVAPERRRRGWGRALVEHAARLAHGRGRSQLVLAVDERNSPAISVYRQAGFTEFARRRLLLLPLVDD